MDLDFVGAASHKTVRTADSYRVKLNYSSDM
jgi:hypothetical protein